MCPRVRPIYALLLLVACLFWAGNASAWVESTIVSDTITVAVEPSGQAVIGHELVMRVRGGPLKSTELSGVDSDAEPLDDAVVVALGGKSESLPLLISRGDDDTLHLEVNSEKGLRNGSYAFRFSYRTNLRENSRIDERNNWAQLSWIGPRYEVGLDVAKVIFRLPYSPSAPRIPEASGESEDPAEAMAAQAMLSNLRRTGALDELELIRPHVAKGEPVLWRVWASASLFPWLSAKDGAANDSDALAKAPLHAPMRRGLPIVLSCLFACIFAVIVWVKSQYVKAEAERQQASPRSLVPIDRRWRALCAGLFGGFAILLAVRIEAPTYSALALFAAMLFTVYLRPLESRKLRGPGRWLPLAADEAWHQARKPLSGAWLDASTKAGRIALSLYVLAALASLGWVFRVEPYYGLMLVMGEAVMLPTWLSGCFSELPWAKEDCARLGLGNVARVLTKKASYRVTVFGRFADGATEPDELRLRISSSMTQAGLLGIEIASTCFGPLAKPELSLLLRVAEGSRIHGEFASKLRFGRGKTPHERIAIVSFAAAPIAQLRRLIDELLGAREVEQGSPPQTPVGLGRSNKAPRSAAKGSVTSKPSKGGSPTQATRAA